MELGSLEVQIFVSLVVVLGTAFVALVCDYLKGSNEQLRERNIELRARQDERDKLGLSNPAQWLQGLAALARDQGTLESSVKASGAAPAAQSPAAPAEQDLERKQPSRASQQEIGQMAEPAARVRARHEEPQRKNQGAAAEPPAAEPPRLKVLTFERAETREPLDLQEEIERVAALSQAAEGAVEAPAALVEAEAAPVPEAPVEAPAPETVPLAWEIEPAAAGMIGSLPEAALPVPSVTVNAEDQQPVWTATVVIPEAPAAAFDPLETSETLEAVCAPEMEPAPAVHLMVPAGFLDVAALAEILENPVPYTGVVVSIGINNFDSLRAGLETNPEPMDAVNRMIESMLRPSDFACRYQDDEFLLLFPGESGASAQRRLFQVSEKLWDFQLRSLGDALLMFSWGGFDVTGEPLAAAVTAARERMFQTRQSRKPSPVDFSSFRRRVVNG